MLDDCEDIVIESLKQSYAITCATYEDDDDTLLSALDRVIKYYLSRDDWPDWEYDKIHDDRFVIQPWPKAE